MSLKNYLSVFVIISVNRTLAIFYTKENSTDVFRLYKEKYNKFYKTKDEEENRYKVFITNLNTVDKLNANSTDINTFYVLNQYADLDPQEIEEQFALEVKPCK